MALALVVLAVLGTVAAFPVDHPKDFDVTAYMEAAKDMKSMMEGVKRETEAVTRGHATGDVMEQEIEQLERGHQKRVASTHGLGLASANSLTMEGSDLQDTHAQVFLRGLQAWRKGGRKASEAASSSDDLDIPDEDASLKPTWGAVDRLRIRGGLEAHADDGSA